MKDLLETWLLNSAHHGLHINIGRGSKTPEITREVVLVWSGYILNQANSITNRNNSSVYIRHNISYSNTGLAGSQEGDRTAPSPARPGGRRTAGAAAEPSLLTLPILICNPWCAEFSNHVSNKSFMVIRASSS